MSVSWCGVKAQRGPRVLWITHLDTVESGDRYVGRRLVPHSFMTVDVVPHPLNGNGSSGSKIRVLNGCVASISEDTIYISNIIYFPMNTVSEDFVPYKGDLLEVEYSTEPGISNIKATSVKPTRCIHTKEVSITSIHGRNGVIDDTIFFTLESVKLPDGYIPQVYDIVNVVMVESIQFCYIWRAVSVTPAQKSSSGFQDDGGLWWPKKERRSQSI
ncbi:cancer/testis antigen 55 [Trachypithecus francoisi]|uniref:cancer/testis antigen 55 n=1 Tax=Trachypithecus francoisi TaxID=54180 RepID=UPI00141ACD27|nr:cancer/testis antigen 55 [Trachypithecus francoisi]